MSDACLFCRIVAGDIPADVVSERDRTLALRDIEPQAPTHVLVITREHYADLSTLVAADPTLVAEVVAHGAQVAADDGLEAYRFVFNTGSQAGQSVFHVHGHVLGGRPMGWPPG